MMAYLISRLKAAHLYGTDVNKPDKPLVPRMGALASIFGFTGSILIFPLVNHPTR
jgi:UDP-N-acetylmuramyl pentapeptide phosphotransferase/UDP-N-acetylglucosamine-1-phosphate transferase